MKKSLLAIFLAIVLIATQFSMLLSVSAETTYTALTGRDDFEFGVTIRGNNGYAIYQDSYAAIMNAKSLGSSVMRIKNEGLQNSYIKGLSEIAAQKDIELMLYDTNIHQYVNGVAYSDLTADSINAIKDYYTTLATELKGKIAYYQVGNEMDIPSKIDGKSGIKASHYNNLDTYAVGIYTAVNAIKAVDPDVKVVVNTSWIDVGFIEGIKNVSIDKTTGLVATSATAAENKTTVSWDLNGMDWYSNGANEDFRNFEDWSEFGKVLNYDYVIEKLSQWDEDVIVCEAGLWPNGTNEDGSIKYIEDASWLAEFAQYAYAQPKVKGFLAFELYDVVGEPAYYGLIDNNKERKDTFNVLQALYGGTDVVRDATIPAVTATELAGDVLNKVYTGTEPFYLDNLFWGNVNKNMFFQIEFDPIALEEGTFNLEFDVYVEDAAAFRAAAKAAGFNLAVVLKGDNSLNRVASKISVENISKDGWNHIVLTRTHFFDGSGSNWSALKEINFGYNGSNSTTNYTNPSSGLKMAVSNVCITKITKTTVSNVGTLRAEQFSSNIYKGRLGSERHANGIFGYSLDSNNKTGTFYLNSTKFAANGYIEFDVYISNYENFTKSLTQNAAGEEVNYGLQFLLSNRGDAKIGNCLQYDITNQITKSGWNHIILCRSSANNRNINPFKSNSFTSGNSASKSYSISFYDKSSLAIPAASTTNVCPAGNDFFAMTNVTMSDLASPEKNSVYEMEVAAVDVTKTEFVMGSNFEKTNSNSKFTWTTAIDVTDAEYIEFDFYVDTYTGFMNILNSNNRGINFILLDENGNADSKNFKDQITKSGWNHIVLKKSEFTRNKLSWDNVTGFRLKLGSTSHTVPANETNFTMKFANFAATKEMETPDKLMSDYTSIGEDKILPVETVGGAFLCELTESIDIEKDKMLEFDIYVEGTAVTGNTTFAMLDGNGFTAMFVLKSQLVSDSWNHVQIDIADFEFEEGFSFAEITSWGLINEESGVTGYIANLYAAGYVDGDASRDGEFNILDLIRSKKHALGIDNAKTNVCAADYDDNYELNAVDFVEMRIALLAK